MSTILTKIVTDKREWLNAQQQKVPLSTFKDKIVPSDRNFYEALSNTNTVFILECKKASPSKGLIRADFDLDAIASVYRQHANAISVLTDEKYFQGHFAYLNQVRAQVTQPILCKDFMISPYQVYLARYHQADAILLMLSVLNDEEYRKLATIAHQLNMGILTEVSNEEELDRAIQLQAKVVGINNRNLRDLSVDTNRTKTLAPRLPSDTIVISESGIHNHQQVRELSQYAQGFLIGSALMAEDNLELAVRRVTLGENKVCGLTHSNDAQAAYQAGAVFGGLIFVEASPRCITSSKAIDIIQSAPLQYVAVFQNTHIDDIVKTTQNLDLFAIQLHGDESPEFITELRQHVTCEIWKAHGIDNQLPEYQQWAADRHLFDCKVGQKNGGTGQKFDWTLLNHHSKSQIILAGGLTPKNAQHASQLGCLGLDFNSGVEASVGQKDPTKLYAAFHAIRQY